LRPAWAIQRDLVKKRERKRKKEKEGREGRKEG
jgi:hypothetical protein